MRLGFVIGSSGDPLTATRMRSSDIYHLYRKKVPDRADFCTHSVRVPLIQKRASLGV